MGLTDRLLVELGATPERLARIQTQVDLETLKQEARKCFRSLVFRYHPDRNPGDNGVMFKSLTEAMKWLEELQLPRFQIHTVTYIYPESSTNIAVSPKKVYDAKRAVLIKST